MRTCNVSGRAIHFQENGLPLMWTVPTSPPFPALQTGRLWAGIGGPADWGTEHLAMNVMKTARAWIGHLEGQWGGGDAIVTGVLDANGYPTEVPSSLSGIETMLLTEQPIEAAPTLNGRYRFTYEGAGTMNLLGAGVSNITTSPGLIEFDFVVVPTASLIIQISATAPGNHLRNFAIYKTEYAARVAQGFVTRPDYEYGTIGVLRFMDLLTVNNSTGTRDVGDWPSANYYSWNGKGIPMEDVCKIANELGVSPWINLHHQATDAYIQREAQVLRDNLNPALTCYVEWSNEVWNFLFGQTAYCVQQAQALWGVDPGTGGAYWQQYAGGRAARCMDIFSTVFAGQTNRIVRVAAVHTGWQGLEASFLDAPLWVGLGNPAPRLSFDAIAVTGYFGGGVYDEPIADALEIELSTNGYQSAVNWLVARIEGAASVEGSLAELYQSWDYFRGVCDTRGFDLIMYEGGTHVLLPPSRQGNTTMVDFIIDFNYSPEMGDIYRQLFTQWDTVADGGFNHFVTFGYPSRFGSWGAVRWRGDSNPRSVVMFEYNEAPLSQPGTPVGGQTLDAYYMLNSLHNHDAGAGNANTSTGNWLRRMALQAPNGGNTYTLGSLFGFANAWETPPRGGSQEEVPSPYITGTNSWTNAGQIEVVGFVPDNFSGPTFDPNVVNDLGFAYQPRLLELIDAWQTNAPNASRRYVVYAGWPDMGTYGDPATISAGQITAYRTWALGGYQTWMELLVSRLQAAWPTLDIRLHDVSRALMLTWRDTVVSTVPVGTLFEDDAPHGRSTWYFLAAVAEYIELFDEKPTAGFVFNPAWNVNAVVTANYQAIVDYMWGVLRP